MADMSFIRSFPRYAVLSDEELRHLGSVCTEELHRHGAHVVRQYETENPAVYFIKEGKVRIVRQESRIKKVLATLGPGDFFGEMAVLDHGPRSASAECATDTVLVTLPQGRFEYLEEQSPALALKLIKTFAKELVLRLRSTNEKLVEREKYFPAKST